MMKSNRLINDFRKQDRHSIWKHIEAMSVNYAVYSTFKIGVEPHLTGKDVYVYANEENLVVVCVDCYKEKEKPTYEEGGSIGPVILNRGQEPCDSVVWKLKETMNIMERRLSLCHFDLPVYGVLLTEARITNAEDLEDVWESNNIRVFEGFKDLRHRRASVNADDELKGHIFCNAALDSELDAKLDKTDVQEEPKSSLDVDDEFEKMLKEFIEREFDSTPVEENVQKNNDDLSDNDDFNVDFDDDDDHEDDDRDDDDDDEINLDDFPEGSVLPDDETSFPSGEIEQNNNISVKVEILRPIANPREELDKLVGCADIKRRMDELLALTSYNKMMHELFPNSKQHEVSLHSVFLGRPGTGKTTVCKIFGSLLRQVGALSKGHVVVCDRGTFIGTLWGDEERSVRQVLEMAKGGVLMIDEAYLLNGKHENDPGKLVIQLLMSILSDEKQRDIAVVLCGYKEPMMKLLSSNPGLQSRFPNRFEFSDFTVDELLEITQCRVKDYDYQFTAKAWEKYRQVLTQAYQVRDPETWGNARFIANQLDRIYIQHATRCVKQQPKDKRELLKITPEDILPIEVPRQKAKIGF